ncbi:MAG: ribokinase [Spirochaetaceae bacterium]|nr:ribokinase [Spirochaetaceae bacterium]
MRVLNFGSLNIDYVYRVDSFVRPGETKAALQLATHSGGKGLNQSIALARAGVKVCHAGKVGTGGTFLVETLKKSGVDTDSIEISSLPTGHTIIQVDNSGANCILLFPGANADIDEKFADRILPGFGSGDMLLLQNEISGIGPIMRKAAARGMAIVMNPSPFDSRVLSYPLDLVSIFLLNEIEAEGLSGEPDPEKAAPLLGEKFPSARIVITCGAKGSLCMDKGRLIRQKAYPAKAVDTTAAGDTFTGYFLAGLIEGLDTAQAMDLASRAAAICVTRKGAADSVPLRSELG